MTIRGDKLPIPEPRLDVPKHPNVSQGIIDQLDEVGTFARLDRPDLPMHSDYEV